MISPPNYQSQVFRGAADYRLKCSPEAAMSAGDGCPRAREDGLVIEAIGDELLVYDTGTSRAHSLNASAAAVFQACDGTRPVEEIGQATGLDADAVALALADLGKSGLLAAYTEPSERVSRRTVIRRLAVAGAGIGVAVPVIRSIVAPSAAMAGSTGRNARNLGECGAGLSACSPGSTCHLEGPYSHGFCYRQPGASCYHGAASSSTSVCYGGSHSGDPYGSRCPSTGIC
jgi:hypothetical protein